MVENPGVYALLLGSGISRSAEIPTGWEGLSESASLKTYAFQLHAYADALRRMGRRVDTVALWFVRSGTSVRWTP